MIQIIDRLPWLYEASSPRACRSRLGRVFRDVTGAVSCRIEPLALRTRQQKNQIIHRLALGDVGAEPHEVRLFFRSRPPATAIARGQMLVPHASRLLTSFTDQLPQELSPVSPWEIVGQVRLEGGSVLALRQEKRASTSGTLTTRQREVLALAIKGNSDRQIADALGVATRTVSNQMTAILRKLNVGSRHDLLRIPERAS